MIAITALVSIAFALAFSLIFGLAGAYQALDRGYGWSWPAFGRGFWRWGWGCGAVARWPDLRTSAEINPEEEYADRWP